MDLKASKVLLILLVLIGCKKTDNNGYRIYTIKEGKHRSTYAYKASRDTIFNWDIIFDSSAIYTTEDPDNEYDINKCTHAVVINMTSLSLFFREHAETVPITWRSIVCSFHDG